eukprot:snap_masked-scaffold_24-processed-gene-3.15-mRNA-1 protein AED:1.00 eAED:1.00 QI:0/-1/0/0/-1/1/1/0/90
MGKGSNVSKANRAREKAAQRVKQEGKGGGGKQGMEARKDKNVVDKMNAKAAERAKVKALREAKKQKAEKENQRKKKNTKEDLSELEKYLN